MIIDGQTKQWEIGAGAAFPGEADVRVEVLKGPTRNLNLITRRGRCEGSIELHRLNEPLSLGGGSGPVLVLSGSVGLKDGTRLGQSHLLLPGTGEEEICGPDALIALVHVEGTSKNEPPGRRPRPWTPHPARARNSDQPYKYLKAQG